MKLEPIIPFEPVNADQIPEGENWVAQVKWDGVRILTYYDGKHVKLFNRRLNERTVQYPELTEIRTYCSADSVILDGEVIALEQGKPSFQKVMKRDSVRKLNSVMAAKNQVPITYMIFDILFYNGSWIVDKPLQERQEILNRIMKENGFIQLVRNQSDANSLFQAVVEHDLEGIIVKDLHSKYAINGKDKRWQKKKVFKDLYAVVGGVTYRSGIVNALLLGLYDDLGRFWYIGHAGTGKLTQQNWRGITDVAQQLRIQERPFFNVPERNKDAVWIKPELTVKIKFMEWTRSKTLRQPSIQSFVKVDPKECTFGQS